MAQNDAATESTETKTITVLYTRPGTRSSAALEEGSAAWQHARDLGFGLEYVDAVDAVPIDEVYEPIVDDVELEIDEEIAHTPVAIAETVYHRLQGARIDDELGYDGSRIRSSMIGDLYVIDGAVWICARVGFEYVGDVGDLDGIDG